MTMNLSRAVAAAAIFGVSFAASAETYEFDTVTAYKGGNQSAITGVPRNSTTPVTVAFYFGTNDHGCIPAILMMMEKPGRYYLTLITSPHGAPPAGESCTLTLRN